MRGKKGAQAANRKDRGELEQRATAAEHAVRRLEKDLLGLRERTSEEILALRVALSDARKQRGEAASPALVAAEARIADLMKELREEREGHHKTQQQWRKLTDRVMFGALMDGLTEEEAMQRLAEFMGEDVEVRPAAAVKYLLKADTSEDFEQAEGFARALTAQKKRKLGAAIARNASARKADPVHREPN